MAATATMKQEAPASRRPAVHTAFGPMMITALVTSLVVLVVIALAAWLLGPADALLGSVAGVLLATQFFAFGALGLRLLMQGPSGGMLFGALAIYGIQVTVLLYVLMLVPHAAVPAPRWFALGAAVETLAWQAAQSVAVMRTRAFVFTPPEGGQA